MCYTCYEKAGSPKIVNDSTITTAEAINKIYEYSEVGGNAHVVVDDWNLEDSHIDYTLNEAIPKNSYETSPEQLEAEKNCLLLLKKLTLDERISAMAIAEEFIKVE